MIGAELFFRCEGGIVLFRTADLRVQFCRAERLFCRGNGAFRLTLEFVDELSRTLFVGDVAQILHQLGNVSLFAEEADAHAFQCFFVFRVRERGAETSLEFFDSFLHTQSSFFRTEPCPVFGLARNIT